MEAATSLPVSEAAKLVGRTRMALMKAIEKGKISAFKDAHGRWYIDPAELQRVYKVVSVANENTLKTVADGSEVVALAKDAQIQDLKAQIDDLRQQRDDWKSQADNWMKQAQQLALTPPTKQSAGFWAKMFSK